jgi:hypothetical protein
MSELDELSKCVVEIRATRYDYEGLDFKDVEQYCIAKRDETLTIFLEMENFIQKNMDIFYRPNDTWVKRASNSNYGMVNEHNRVAVFQNGKGQYYVWIDRGIVFFVNAGVVVYISKMMQRGEPWNTAFDNFKFHYFPEFDEDGKHPTEGYSRLSFYPRMANYFPKENPVTFSDWSNLKKRVDEDYQNAIEVRNLLIQAVKEIQEDEQEHLNEIKALKESSKEA